MVDAEGNETFSQLSSGLPMGLGSMVKANGESYVGSWQYGDFHGIGILKMKVNHSYCGQFYRGKPQGLGLLRNDNKLVNGDFDFEELSGTGSYSKPDFEYQGTFTKGVIKGFGSFGQVSTGTKYVGFFQNGEYNGEGRLISAGKVYLGMFSHNQRAGLGQLIDHESKEEFVGYWSADHKEAFGRQSYSFDKIYTGEWKRDMEDGIAVVEYRSKGYVYTGQISSGERSGVGKLESLKYTYIGDWKGNKRHGLGIEIDHKGSKYFGYWEQGKKNGIGEETGKDFNFKGEWKDGKPHGKGIMRTQEGEEVCVVFDEGQIVSTVEFESLEEIQRIVNQLNYETFNSEYQAKISTISKQVGASMKLLDDRMKVIEDKIALEEEEMKEKMSYLDQKSQEVLDEARRIEMIVAKARETFQKEGGKAKQDNDADIPYKKDINDKSSKALEDRIAPLGRDLVGNRSTKPLPQAEDATEGVDANRDRGIADIPISAEGNQKALIDLDDQARRLAQYEKWLLKETQKIKDQKKHKRSLTRQKEYSTNSMLEEEKESIRKRFDKEFRTMTLEIQNLTTENAKHKQTIERLMSSKKELEAYCNDVDNRNFTVAAANEALKELSATKELEYETDKNNLQLIIQAKSDEIESLLKVVAEQKLTIAELSENKLKLEIKITENEQNFEDLKQMYIRALVEISALSMALELRVVEKIEDNMKISQLNEEIDKLTQDLKVEKCERAKEKEGYETQISELNIKYMDQIEKMANESDIKERNYQEQIAKCKKQIRVLESGGEVNDTDEQLRLKEVGELKALNTVANLKIEDLSARLETSQLEVENLTKMLADREKSLKESISTCNESQLRINQLEEMERSFCMKQKEWNDMKEALANNIKDLKDREQELKAELQSKKTIEREEVRKRNEKLSKNFFNDSVKPKILMGLSSRWLIKADFIRWR